MINSQWLELPMSRTLFYGHKDVWAIEVRLYFYRTLDNQLFWVFSPIKIPEKAIQIKVIG